MNASSKHFDATSPTPAPELPRCGNCESALLGPFCHMCGQPVRSPVREFFSFVYEGTSEFMRPDGKFFRTLAGLFFRPGLLTSRYLDGQRVNFIKPVKLYFSLSVVLFLLISLSSGVSDKMQPKVAANQEGVHIGFGSGPDPKLTPETKPTPDAKPTSEAKPAPAVIPPAAAKPVEIVAKAATKPEAKADKKSFKAFDFEIRGKPWHPTDNPVICPYLPDFANTWVNKKMAHINETAEEAEKHPEKVIDSLFRVLPTTMFILLPIFALVLKFFYFFKKRLYAEHLLVAVQSHSFIFLSFILIVLLDDLSLFGNARLTSVGQFLTALIWFWIPLYLLLMQKRVYRQGWFWTLSKFSVCGIIYSLLLSVGMAFSVVAALVNM